MDEGKLVIRCSALVDNWKLREAKILNENRDACELDITCVEARDRGIVAGNETFIGRRVIKGNIQRELPTFIQYLSGSYRHVSAVSVDGTVPAEVLATLEKEFTTSFRIGNWLEQHLQVVSSSCLHGRGVFLVLARPTAPLNTVPVYVPPEDFIFPLGARDIQKSPMLGIRYNITVDQFEEWRATFKWEPDVAQAILDTVPEAERVNQMYEVFMMFQKVQGVVQALWFSSAQNKLLKKPVQFDGGLRDELGRPEPLDVYPVFPLYYDITENPNLIERKGRAHADMHDQEALTMIWSANVNGCLRASEVYVSLKTAGVTENPEITQTTFVMDPGKILKQPIDFNHADWPDGAMLQFANALKTENASAAGQIDFAAQARKDSRKTAKELTLAQEQTSANNSVSLTMFAAGYKSLTQFMWRVLQHNMATGFNTTFMAAAPAMRDALKTAKITLAPAGDIDYIEREEKLKLYTQYYQMFAGTAVGEFFQKQILELAFPLDFPKMVGLLTDNSKQMGAALLQLVQAVPTATLPPDAQAKFHDIIAEAQKTFGQPQTPNAPNQNAPAAGSQP